MWFVTFALPSHIVALFAEPSILFAHFYQHIDSRLINLKSQNNIVLLTSLKFETPP